MYQSITIVGNLGGDPDLKYLPDGTAITTLSVATNRRWTGRDGQPGEETTWFRVSAWGKQAEPCNQYLKKGSKVLVIGILTPDRETGGPRVWMTDAGEARASYEIRATEVKFLDNRPTGDGQRTEASGPPPARSLAEDEIPF